MSLGDVVSKLGDDLSGLLTTQVEIAKLEIKDEVSKAARGAGILTSGAFAAVVAVFMLSAALAWAIAVPLNEWAGFLIVGALWSIAAVVLGLIGKKRLEAVDAVPETTRAELDADKRLAQRLP
ncbi:phage holin family protein [Ilumatobacter sp.]|uniref:phage holin family protein n=1 Tax=Ilumatobacter sp. TaxID=1967498 RepID=UPI003B523313